MPNWQPNWNDVVWNWGASDGAASALRHSADMLDQTSDERKYRSRAATAEWRGEYRDRFDQELAQILRRAHDLASEYRGVADRIVNAAQRARAEQRHREEERARWWRQKRAEEAARRRRR